MRSTTTPPPPAAAPTRPVWIDYAAPMALFLALTQAEALVPRSAYPWLYTSKAVLVTLALVLLRAPWREVRADARVLLPAVLVGLAVFLEWVAVERWVPYLHTGSRTAYDPYREIGSPGARGLFLAVRLWGLVAMVPFMEEVFWRSFLLRWVSNPAWTTLRVGDYSWTAFWIVTGLFALAHPEWLAAAVCASAYALLLRGTRSLFACIVAHATTNLALGLYVLATGSWSLW